MKTKQNSHVVEDGRKDVAEDGQALKGVLSEVDCASDAVEELSNELSSLLGIAFTELALLESTGETAKLAREALSDGGNGAECNEQCRFEFCSCNCLDGRKCGLDGCNDGSEGIEGALYQAAHLDGDIYLDTDRKLNASTADLSEALKGGVVL